MPSNAYGRFEKKIGDISFLLEIHRDIAGSNKGRKQSKLRVLHKSAIVLLCAAWETYIESLLEESLAYLSANVLSGNSANLNYSGMQDILRKSVQKGLQKVNTPDSKNVKELFDNLLGIEDIRKTWGRPGQGWESARDALDELFAKRHRIVHGSVTDPEFIKADVDRFEQFLWITVTKTDRETRKHLNFLTGSNPW